MSRIETTNATVQLRDDGLLYVVMRPGCRDTEATAREIIAASVKHAGSSSRGILIDMSAVAAITREARSYYAYRPFPRPDMAVALVVGSRVSRMIANFFLGLNRPPVPVRMFDDELVAAEWLHEKVRELRGAAASSGSSAR